jgi:hypothetical protein
LGVARGRNFVGEGRALVAFVNSQDVTSSDRPRHGFQFAAGNYLQISESPLTGQPWISPLARFPIL